MRIIGLCPGVDIGGGAVAPHPPEEKQLLGNCHSAAANSSIAWKKSEESEACGP
jgi:hypothetical protein